MDSGQHSPSVDSLECDVCGHNNPENLFRPHYGIIRCKKCAQMLLFQKYYSDEEIKRLPLAEVERLNARWDRFYSDGELDHYDYITGNPFTIRTRSSDGG